MRNLDVSVFLGFLSAPFPLSACCSPVSTIWLYILFSATVDAAHSFWNVPCSNSCRCSNISLEKELGVWWKLYSRLLRLSADSVISKYMQDCVPLFTTSTFCAVEIARSKPLGSLKSRAHPKSLMLSTVSFHCFQLCNGSPKPCNVTHITGILVTENQSSLGNREECKLLAGTRNWSYNAILRLRYESLERNSSSDLGGKKHPHQNWVQHCWLAESCMSAEVK